MARKVAFNNLIPILFTVISISTSVIAQGKPTITTKDASALATTIANNTRAIIDDGRSPEEIAAYPVVLFENHTYWPLSYPDDRFSFALVVTQNDATNNYTYVNVIEAQGARYIKRIYTDSADGTVVFVGQGEREAAVSLEVLRRATLEDDTSATTGDTATGSPTDTTAASATATSSAPPRPSKESSKGESITGAVAGGAFGGLVVLVVLVIVVWKCWLSPRKDPRNSSSHHTNKGSVNLSTTSRTRTRDGTRTVTGLDDADERAAEARRLGGIPDWQARTAYARAMSPVERGRGPRGGYHYPFKGEDRT